MSKFAPNYGKGIRKNIVNTYISNNCDEKVR